MNKTVALALLLISFASASHAQLRKCVAPDGKITFSDVMCPGNAKSAQTINERAAQPTYRAPERYNSPPERREPATRLQQEPERPAGPTQAQIYERQLTGKIAGHLAAGDIGTATVLATTAEHYAMIAEARRDQERAGRAFDANKRANDAAKRAALPYECKSTTTRTPWDYNNRSSTTTRCGSVAD